jgi:anti-sigma regulatory factor (Ser/Thr protein kinase)
MTEKGFSISSIAQELNRKIKQILPTERFVAATLASIDLTKHAIRIWNGGAPPAMLVSADGNILHRWRSNHPPLGILDSEDFDGQTDAYYWHEAAQLIICSDGIAEAENDSGERFGSEQIIQALSCQGAQTQFNALKHSLEEFLGDKPGLDDISLIGVQCPMDFAGETITPDLDEKEFNYRLSPSEWKLGINLAAAELKSLDVLPLLISWLGQARLTQKQCRELFLIITELYNNALDHGILGLESGLKTLEDGFDRYLTLREERLAALLHASVEIELQRQRREDGEYLVLRVKDSGAGFDATRLLNCDISVQCGFSGRGIALVKSLCARVEYLGSGNEVIAYYLLR